MKPRILVASNKKWSNYAHAVEYCGGIAVEEYDHNSTDAFDGLLLCGGNDIHPAFYGQEVMGAVDFDTPRDRTEIELARAFIDTGKPVLGICRGMQLLNVALGGTLIQDLPNAKSHRATNGVDTVHKVSARGFCKELYGEEFSVNSFHHQAVDILGKGLMPTLMCGDVVEGFEDESGNILGVQFHPERMCLDFKREDTVDGIKIFEYFVNICKK